MLKVKLRDDYDPKYSSWLGFSWEPDLTHRIKAIAEDNIPLPNIIPA